MTLKNPSTTQEGVWSFSICLGSIGISQFIFVASPKAKVPASQCLLVIFTNGVWLKTMPKCTTFGPPKNVHYFKGPNLSIFIKTYVIILAGDRSELGQKPPHHQSQVCPCFVQDSLQQQEEDSIPGQEVPQRGSQHQKSHGQAST